MKLLAMEKEKPGLTSGDFRPHLEAEAIKAWEYYREGVIREMYFREDEHTAVLVLECSGVEEAKKILAKLPLVKEGLITFDIIPLVPYTGFSRLFANNH